MTRRPHTTADVARAMPIAADTVAADGHMAASLAASFAMRAAAVQALVVLRSL